MKLKPCLLNMAGSAVLAFGLYNIHSLAGVTEGGVLGLMLLFSHWFSISPAISGFVMNSICYIIGAIILGKRFIIYSSVEAIFFSLFYAICEQFPPLFPQIAGYPLYASVLGAVFVGVGAGLCIRGGGATSGDDAIAMSLSFLTGINIKWVFLVSDAIVLALSLSYIPIDKILYSLITVILSGQIVGLINDLKLPKKSIFNDARYFPRDVLVGTLRNTDQLSNAIENRFYHIPASRLATTDFPIRYIAIYQSNCKFGDDAGIRYWGEVENCSKVKRCEISEIPKNSKEAYYRFDIKEWKMLEKRLIPTDRDFIKLFTTRFLLENSSDIPELALCSERERKLYLQFKDYTSDKHAKREESLGNVKVCFDCGVIVVSRENRTLLSATYSEFESSPISTLRKIVYLSGQ